MSLDLNRNIHGYLCRDAHNIFLYCCSCCHLEFSSGFDLELHTFDHDDEWQTKFTDAGSDTQEFDVKETENETNEANETEIRNEIEEEGEEPIRCEFETIELKVEFEIENDLCPETIIDEPIEQQSTIEALCSIKEENLNDNITYTSFDAALDSPLPFGPPN